MAEFLESRAHINIRIEDTVSQAKEFVYLISPNLSQIPQPVFTKLWKALSQGVKVFLIYRHSSLVEQAEISKLEQLRNISIYHHEHLHVNANFNEKEAVVTSLNISGEIEESNIEFGIYFRKNYAADMYEKLLSESKRIQRQAVKMVLHNGKLIERSIVEIRPPIAATDTQQQAASSPDFSKKLTVKEKQYLILDIFSKECKDCVIKVEDHERIRVQGKGIVIFTNKEKVEVIFVRYDTYNLNKDAVKEYIITRHPDLQLWLTYNRITISVDRREEVISVFSTIKDALTSLNLV